jgi:predicted CXXCH cytochrome family protein
MQRMLSCLIVFAAILSIAMVGVLGCSPQKHYQTLSFFFDGVPAPDAGGTHRTGAEGQPIRYLHKPYADGKCGGCHASDNMEMSISRPVTMTPITSSVCLKCHGKMPSQYPVMHGPVAAAVCLMCHSPHESPVPHLLLSSAPRLCVQCHAPEMMVPARPEHKDEKADCLGCHFGHGGPAHGLLRPKAPAATQPAALPVMPPISVATGETGQ